MKNGDVIPITITRKFTFIITYMYDFRVLLPFIGAFNILTHIHISYYYIDCECILV